MQSKGCLNEKRTVSIFVGQTTVITLISYALLFCPLKIQAVLHSFFLVWFTDLHPSESHSDLVYLTMQHRVR